MRISSRARWITAGAAVLVLLGIGWLLTRPHPAPASEGVLTRSRGTTVAARTTALSDACFSSSTIQPTGRDSANREVYLLTMTLKTDPGSVADLVRTLDRGECASALASATRAARDRVKADTNFGGLAVSYRTSAGARFRLP